MCMLQIFLGPHSGCAVSRSVFLRSPQHRRQCTDSRSGLDHGIGHLVSMTTEKTHASLQRGIATRELPRPPEPATAPMVGASVGRSRWQRYSKTSTVASMIAPNAGRASNARPSLPGIARGIRRGSPSAKPPRGLRSPAARGRRGGSPTPATRPVPLSWRFSPVCLVSPSGISWSWHSTACVWRWAPAGCAWCVCFCSSPASIGLAARPLGRASGPPARCRSAGGVASRSKHASGA